MQRPSITLALLSGAALTAAVVLWQPGYHVVDGDTVRHGYWKWRLVGFDAPAPRRGGWAAAKCPSEIIRGVRAKMRLNSLLAAGKVALIPASGHDPHGNRRGHLLVDGRDVKDILIAEGFAKPWDGHGAKPSWCSR